MRHLLPLAVMLVLLSAAPRLAADEYYDNFNFNMAARMNRLEADNEALRAEMRWMRENAARPPVMPAAPPMPAYTAMPAGSVMPASAAMAPAAGGEEYYTLPQLQAEMKKLAWTKGDFKIVPYGFLWGNMVYATQRTSPGSYTLFVQSATTQGENEFITDVRNTRLGFDVTGPRIAFFNGAQSGGKVEVDFQNSVLSTENKPTIMLRHAYFEIKDEESRLLVGQTWDVISPLLPGMLMYSVGWDGGNIGYRRAQFRAERFLAFSDFTLVTAQGSLNQTVFEDVVTNVRGESPGWPIVEGRVAVTLGDRCPNGLPITFGCSGHIGEEGFDFTGVPGKDDVRRRTWSLNGDLRVPLTQYLGFQAECFTGENLGAFLGGVGQGIDPVTFNCIRSQGGWIELWYDWTPCLHSHFGYAIDDPNNNDLTAVGSRTFNQFYFGNFSYDFTKNFLVGLEVSSWRTLYVGQLPGDAVRCEFVMKYGF